MFKRENILNVFVQTKLTFIIHEHNLITNGV